MKKILSKFIPISFSLVAANIFVWYSVYAGIPPSMPSMHFLDVGQGDAELIRTPGGVSFLIDAGPVQKITTALPRILSFRRYLDIGIVTHPQADHYGGFASLLDNSYRLGMLVVNGEEADSGKENWDALLRKAEKLGIPIVTLHAGDNIRYGETTLNFLSPIAGAPQSKDSNDDALVAKVTTPYFSALFTSDIGSKIEERLIKTKMPLRANILKIAHHGSKFSSIASFLKTVAPQAAIIEVGAKNVYRHPAPETLARLAIAAIPTLRTDEHGTIDVVPENGKLKVYAER